MTSALAVVAAGSLLFAAFAAAHSVATPTFTAAQLTQGKTLFKKNCGTCHTLKAAGTSGSTGPNLGTLKLTVARITTQINGGGGFMPAFAKASGGSLSPAQITSIAGFIYTSEHK